MYLRHSYPVVVKETDAESDGLDGAGPAPSLSLSTVVPSIGMGPMLAIVDLWGYDVLHVLLLLLFLPKQSNISLVPRHSSSARTIIACDL